MCPKYNNKTHKRERITRKTTFHHSFVVNTPTSAGRTQTMRSSWRGGETCSFQSPKRKVAINQFEKWDSDLQPGSESKSSTLWINFGSRKRRGRGRERPRIIKHLPSLVPLRWHGRCECEKCDVSSQHARHKWSPVWGPRVDYFPGTGGLDPCGI